MKGLKGFVVLVVVAVFCGLTLLGCFEGQNSGYSNQPVDVAEGELITEEQKSSAILAFANDTESPRGYVRFSVESENSRQRFLTTQDLSSWELRVWQLTSNEASAQRDPDETIFLDSSSGIISIPLGHIQLQMGAIHVGFTVVTQYESQFSYLTITREDYAYSCKFIMTPITPGMGDADVNILAEVFDWDITEYITSAVSWHDLEPSVPPNIVKYLFGNGLPEGLGDGSEIQIVYYDGENRYYSYPNPGYIRWSEADNCWFARGEWSDAGMGLLQGGGKLKVYAKKFSYLNVSTDVSSNPSSRSFIVGTQDNLITSLKFSAGINEDICVKRLVLTLGGSAKDSDFTSVCMYDTEGYLVGCENVYNSRVDFYSSNGLFNVKKGENKIIFVKADILKGANNNCTFSFSISSANDILASGVVSESFAKIQNCAIGSLHTILPHGNLTLTTACNSPSSQILQRGMHNCVAKFDMIASLEDVRIHSLRISFFKEGEEKTVLGDLVNVSIYDEDGFIDYSAFPTNVAVFSFVDFAIKAYSVKTISIYAGIPFDSTIKNVTAKLEFVSASGISSCAMIIPYGTPSGATHIIE